MFWGKSVSQIENAQPSENFIIVKMGEDWAGVGICVVKAI